MVKAPISFTFGKGDEFSQDQIRILSELYEQLANPLNFKPDIVIREDSDPTTSDIDYTVGTLWVNKDVSGGVPKAYILVNKTSSPVTADWDQIN